MTKTKKWIIWIAIIAVVIGGGVFYLKNKKPVTTYTTADAVSGDLKQTVSVTGDLVANNEITLNFEIGGRVNKVFVKESDQVAAGDTIATLTDATLQKQLEQAKAGLDGAIAGAGSNSDVLREAKVAKENAENVLKDTESLNNQNLKAAQQAVDNAQAYYDDAKTFYDGAVSAQNKLTLTTAENALNAARQALKTAQQQADLSETNAENVLNSTKSKVKTVESEFTKESRDAQVASARATYDLANLNLAKATLISPVNGIITEVNNKPGEVLGTGVIKESFSRVMSLDMIVQSRVPESDIVKIKNGQKADVTFDALTPEDIYNCEIIEIDPASTLVQGVVYYQIKLKINSVDQRLKPGMSANIDVKTAEKKDIVSIPSRAIKTEGNKKFVDVLLVDNTTKKVFVETGLEGNEGMMEIKSGLKGGEKVVTFMTTK